MSQWIAACDVDDVDLEDVIPLRPRGQRLRGLPLPGRRLLRHRRALHPRAAAALRRPGHGRRHRVPQAQRPLRLHHRQGARRAGARRRRGPTRRRSRTAPSSSSCRERALGAAGGHGDRRRGRMRHAGRVRAARERVERLGSRSSAPRRSSPTSARRSPRPGRHKPICDDERLRAADMTYLPGTQRHRPRSARSRGDARRRPHAGLRPSCCSPPAPRPARCRSTAPPVHLVRTHADAQALHARLRAGTRVAVIGGGFIGLELAAAAAALGADVTVLELADRLMGRAVPAGIAHAVAARHAAAGVDVRCGTAVDRHRQTLGRHRDRPRRRHIGRGRRRRRRRRRRAVHRAGRAGRAGRRRRHRSSTPPSRPPRPTSSPPGDCCRFPHPLYPGRPLRLESWRAAQEQGDHRRPQHARRRRGLRRRPVVLERPARPVAAGRGPRRPRRRTRPCGCGPTASSSGSGSTRTGGSSPRPPSAPATPWPRTSASPRCSSRRGSWCPPTRSPIRAWRSSRCCAAPRPGSDPKQRRTRIEDMFGS